MDSSDIDKLQTDLNRYGEFAVENSMTLNRGKRKALRFTKTGVKERVSYYLAYQLMPEGSSFK
jgi:hypothetical protein